MHTSGKTITELPAGKVKVFLDEKEIEEGTLTFPSSDDGSNILQTPQRTFTVWIYLNVHRVGQYTIRCYQKKPASLDLFRWDVPPRWYATTGSGKQVALHTTRGGKGPVARMKRKKNL